MAYFSSAAAERPLFKTTFPIGYNYILVVRGAQVFFFMFSG